MASSSKMLTRMKRELEILERDPVPGIVCYPVDDSFLHFSAEIKGPQDTPYESGSFKVEVQIPQRYPMEPPKMQFITPIYHPNVDDVGRICLDILKMPPKGSWSPSLNISTTLTSLRLLMADPNPDDPLSIEIAREFKENRVLYFKKAQELTKKYASGNENNDNKKHELDIAQTGAKDEEVRAKIDPTSDEKRTFSGYLGQSIIYSKSEALPIYPQKIADGKRRLLSKSTKSQQRTETSQDYSKNARTEVMELQGEAATINDDKNSLAQPNIDSIISFDIGTSSKLNQEPYLKTKLTEDVQEELQIKHLVNSSFSLEPKFTEENLGTPMETFTIQKRLPLVQKTNLISNTTKESTYIPLEIEPKKAANVDFPPATAKTKKRSLMAKKQREDLVEKKQKTAFDS
ncbi:hypothetical protein G9A89_010278 [Geosiphon pyriformis]|nr:hypothetical protein G9A89_010278 [Geosiphon pyriformis]